MTRVFPVYSQKKNKQSLASFLWTAPTENCGKTPRGHRHFMQTQKIARFNSPTHPINHSMMLES